MSETHPSNCFADALRLARIERQRVRGVDLAESTRPRAARSVDHEGGRTGRPAFEDVGAPRFVADGDQFEVAEIVLDAEEGLGRPGPDPQPRRLARADRQALFGFDPGAPQPQLERAGPADVDRDRLGNVGLDDRRRRARPV